jgi:hypothetical protein
MNASVGECYCCRHLVIFAQVARLHLNNFAGIRTKHYKICVFPCQAAQKQRFSVTDLTIGFLVSEFRVHSA